MASINRAIPLASGEVLVFSDANNFFEPGALRALVAGFNDPQVGAVSGSKRILSGDGALGDSEGLYWKYEAFIKTQESRLGNCVGASGEILALRKELYQTPPDYVINDDFFLAMSVIRRGRRVVYAPQARSLERVSLTAQDEIARRARIVAGRYQALALAPLFLPMRNPLAVWQVLSHKFLRPLVPLVMLAALAANLAALAWPAESGTWALLRLSPPYNILFLAVQLLFYGLAWLTGREVVRSRLDRAGLVGKLLYLPAFLVNSNLAAVIGLFQFLTGRQTALWRRVGRRESRA